MTISCNFLVRQCKVAFRKLEVFPNALTKPMLQDSGSYWQCLCNDLGSKDALPVFEFHFGNTRCHEEENREN